MRSSDERFSSSAPRCRSTRGGMLKSCGGSTRSGCFTRGMIGACALPACPAPIGARSGSPYADSYSACRRASFVGECARVLRCVILRAGVRLRGVSCATPAEARSWMIASTAGRSLLSSNRDMAVKPTTALSCIAAHQWRGVAVLR